ncbi:hypothetical protein AB205_0049420 [Aquarana catesbeiana]|uniref:Uncharacterized protein n=1 Tax=Aquarana catesbeiana TaxID=8400 RepID=A0A2G9RX00_AQUCT|nr:hypothetical protein AB205_0049420 [Aquarana catesbeiana]
MLQVPLFCPLLFVRNPKWIGCLNARHITVENMVWSEGARMFNLSCDCLICTDFCTSFPSPLFGAVPFLLLSTSGSVFTPPGTCTLTFFRKIRLTLPFAVCARSSQNFDTTQLRGSTTPPINGTKSTEDWLHNQNPSITINLCLNPPCQAICCSSPPGVSTSPAVTYGKTASRPESSVTGEDRHYEEMKDRLYSGT